MLFCRWANGIEPRNIAEIEKQLPLRKRLAQPEWDDDPSRIESMGDFSSYMGCRVGIF
jgi:hypothetical protein